MFEAFAYCTRKTLAWCTVGLVMKFYCVVTLTAVSVSFAPSFCLTCVNTRARNMHVYTLFTRYTSVSPGNMA